jgi:hypothetical protein
LYIRSSLAVNPAVREFPNRRVFAAVTFPARFEHVTVEEALRTLAAKVGLTYALTADGGVLLSKER